VLAKLWARGRARGWGEVGRLAFDRIKEELWSEDRLIFFLRDTADGAESGPHEKTAGLSVVRATPEHASVYERDIGTDSAETFTERLDDRTRCYLVLDGGRALHGTWVTTGASWVRELRRYFQPPGGHAYVYESFTRADARGRGVYPFALRGIGEDLARGGTEKVWVAVEDDNPASLKSVHKAGFSEAFDISYRRRLCAINVSEPQGARAELCPRCFLKKADQ
jgi:Acetyltransferase (GNAT) family